MCATNHCNCEPDLRLPTSLPKSDGRPNGLSDPNGRPTGLSDTDGRPNGVSDPDGRPSGLSGPDGRILKESPLKNNEYSSRLYFGHPAHIPITGSAKPGHLPHNTIFNRIQPYVSKVTSNPRLRTLLATSQPVHALAIISVGIVFTCLSGEQSSSPKPYSGLTTFAYVASFGLRLGSQYWMTFISGLSLYFTLQRHAFGDVQVVLFPRYFTSNAILSAICLFSYTKLHSHVEWQTTHWVQIITMSLSFLLESLSRLYLAPKVVELIEKKKAIEMTQPGVGKEIGKHDPGALKMCPHYMALHGQFRRKHMAMAIINMTTIAGTIVQLCYISQALCFHPC